jgi:hypothetical protein
MPAAHVAGFAPSGRSPLRNQSHGNGREGYVDARAQVSLLTGDFRR